MDYYKMNLIIGSENGDSVFVTTEEEAYKSWVCHYNNHLKELYMIFKNSCFSHKTDWYKRIDYPTFCEYIFTNSEKYLTPWV